MNESGFYEENSVDTSGKKKKIIIIVISIIVVLAIVGLIIFLVNRGKDEKIELKENFENTLTNALKSYFATNSDYLPKIEGESATITLETLINANLVTDEEMINTCNATDTYGKAYKMQDASIHYSINLSCEEVTTEYDDYKEGTINDLTSDVSDIKFLFMAQEIDIPETLANQKEEKFWKDEIPYSAGTYTITGEKTYYRERELLYRYYQEIKHYYPNDTTNENNINSYYVSIPDSKYKYQGASATVYKWYIESHQKYPTYESTAQGNYTIKGEAGTPKIWASKTRPESASYRTITSGDIYRSREIIKEQTLVDTKYQCTNSTGSNTMTSDVPCNENSTAISNGLTTTSAYQCYYNDGYKTDFQVSNCAEKLYTYGNWSDYTNVSCNVTSGEPHTCEKTSGYIISDKTWAWYTPSIKTYYPSGSTTTDGENTYYAKSPVANALKEESTKTIGYKWYRIETKELGYATNPPSSNAIEDTSKTKWSDFSSYSLIRPESTATNYVEERVQVSLKKSNGEVASWANVTDSYVSLEEMLVALNEKGYQVNTLEDVLNSDKLKYQIKIYYRNPKE